MQVVRGMRAERSTRPEDEQVRIWVDRHLFLKRRWEGVAEDGTPFAFDLESRLTPGCVVHQSEGRDYVIAQREERVIHIPIASPEMAALAGWRIGNLHVPVEIGDGFVRVSWDPDVKAMLEREGWPFAEASVVFRPLRVPPHAMGRGPANPGEDG